MRNLEGKAVVANKKQRSLWQEAWRRFRKNRMAMVGLVFLSILVIIAVANILFYNTRFAEPNATDRELKITIPESLDYEGVFDDLFDKYTTRHELIHVKTSNMGSLYELCYLVRLKDSGINKSFLDEIRCRNGNLNIVCGRISTIRDEL